MNLQSKMRTPFLLLEKYVFTELQSFLVVHFSGRNLFLEKVCEVSGKEWYQGHKMTNGVFYSD